MKKVNEKVRLWARLLRFSLDILIGAYITYTIFKLANYTNHDNILYLILANISAGAIATMVILLLDTCSGLITKCIDGSDIGSSESYAIAYGIINKSALPFVASQCAYLPFTYTEIRYAADMMKKGYLSHTFAKRKFPLFSLSPVISYRLAKRLLKEMKPTQLVVLQIPLREYMDDATYISLHEIRQMRCQSRQSSTTDNLACNVVIDLDTSLQLNQSILESTAAEIIFNHILEKGLLTQSCDEIYVEFNNYFRSQIS